MQGNMFTQSFHIPGTLAANVVMTWTAPFDCQLLHVSACGSNANNGILDIGTSSSVEAYLANKDIGDSNVPAAFTKADFVNQEFPHIPAGTVVQVNLDYDGAAGTATANFTLILSFFEG